MPRQETAAHVPEDRRAAGSAASRYLQPAEPYNALPLLLPADRTVPPRRAVPLPRAAMLQRFVDDSNGCDPGPRESRGLPQYPYAHRGVRREAASAQRDRW